MYHVSDETRIKQKRGTGRLASYIPWYKVHEVPSKGVSWRIKGAKTNRIHHLLSTLEKVVMLHFDSLPTVIDIREQFPLPLRKTLRIADMQGTKHGNDKGVYKVMTTDLLIDFQNEQLAISIKPKKMSKRATMKLLIEQEYWKQIGVRYWLLTPHEIKILIQNGDKD